MAVALAVTLLATAGQVAAQEEDPDVARVEALSLEGAQLFQGGNYREAIVRFKEAYALVPVANLLYNIALSYERVGDNDAAITYYEKFIVADDADPEVRGVALGRLKDLGRARRADVVDPIGPGDGADPELGNNGNGNGGKAGGGSGGNDGADGAGTWTTVGIITAGLGVALVGTGVVFGQISAGEQDNFDQSLDASDKALARSGAEKNALTADILFGAGGLAIVGGITMIILDVTSGDAGDSDQARFTPVVGEDNIGATVTLSF
jgi:tetratricopeptide (TPR) repeat protein